MLCIVFGVMMAALTWAWVGSWAGLVGIAAAVGLYATMRFWPLKTQK